MVKHSLQQGVTIIEMLVVVGIIALVSSVMLFNYSDFSTNVSIRNLTQEVALSIRKAQTYATSVRPIEGLVGVSSREFSGYGASFSTIRSIGEDRSLPDPKKFILFADIPLVIGESPNGTYDQPTDTDCGAPAASTECIETFGINTADRIVGICSDNVLYDPDSMEDCSEKITVDITFLRPNPDAHIRYTKEDNETTENASYAKIVFESAKGLRRSVTVWNTGQISVR